MKKVTIYTTPSCQYCLMAKKFFNDNNVKYNEVDVSTDHDAAHEMVEKSGQMGTPVITVKNDGEEKIIIGFNQEELIKSLGINN